MTVGSSQQGWKTKSECLEFDWSSTKSQTGKKQWWKKLDSVNCVRELRDNFKPRFAFQQWNKGWSWNMKLKKHLSEWARCQKAIGGIYFTKKWRAETLHPGLEFDNFKPRLKSSIFKFISWLNGSFFGGDDRGFLKEGVKSYQMAQI